MSAADWAFAYPAKKFCSAPFAFKIFHFLSHLDICFILYLNLTIKITLFDEKKYLLFKEYLQY